MTCNNKQPRGYRRLVKSIIASAVLGLGSVQAQAEDLWQIYLLALDNDAQLAADRARYQAGLEDRKIFRAPLLPQVRGDYDYRETSSEFENVQLVDDPDGGFATVKISGKSDSNLDSWGVSLTQTIFDASSWFDYKQGKALSEQAAAEFSAAQQDVIIRVATTYFDILLAFDDLETARAEQEANAKQLEQTSQRFEVGLTAITDVHEAQAAFDSSVARRLDAEDRLSIAFDKLTVLTGLNHDEVKPLLPSFQVVPPEPGDRAAWVDFALANNFDLQAARIGAEAARENARARAAEHLPTLRGGYSYRDSRSSGESTGFGITIPTDRSDASDVYSVRLDVPIFTGGLTSARRRQARNFMLQAEESRNFVERNVVQETRSLHRVVTTDEARVAARNQAIISSKSALDATEAGYEVGTRNLVDVLLAQRSLFQARNEYAAAIQSYILNSLELKRVAGVLSPQDLIDLNAQLNQAASIMRYDLGK
ncbi:TolC family outer membrane protein [Biformimicrobium ophioploci]|uniref:Efflux transporter outer membrane subunit OpmH n=1 Tax=Biformimicrobium ophioploci TaxID=3036711 RepID=A0ABQ6M0N0_9GAMM|nr:TolC family outer membrane protein [Microbulbifer sp. NKW57]GMG87887.1 efflux transporter outer membrane subunit OpmH [Microbulbifer sp. NKW57]